MDDERIIDPEPPAETPTDDEGGQTGEQAGNAPEVASKPEPGDDREQPDHSGIADKPGPPL